LVTAGDLRLTNAFLLLVSVIFYRRQNKRPKDIRNGAPIIKRPLRR